MNYFEFYGIPESFAPDTALLKKKFYELSKKYHPDFYANEDEAKQQEILELSTLNNKAYQTLSDPNKRLEYILSLHELLKEGAKPQLPADFLMEMMDINERLMDVEDATQLGYITAEVLAVEDDIHQKLVKDAQMAESVDALVSNTNNFTVVPLNNYLYLSDHDEKLGIKTAFNDTL
eukprot:gene940-947_t